VYYLKDAFKPFYALNECNWEHSQSTRQYAAGPVIPVAVAFSLASPLLGGEIVFDAEPTATYIVLQSFKLCHWQEILRVKSQQSGPLTVPVRLDNSQGFWRIESFAEP
jgi:hypothetical protein